MYNNYNVRKTISKPKIKKAYFKSMPHSEKSAVSSKESHASQREAARLVKKLHNLADQADWVKNRANKQWKQAKEYEAQGRMEQALEAKIRYEELAHRVKRYNMEMREIEKMIGILTFVYSVGLQKGANYATMKMKEPPSYNEE